MMLNSSIRRMHFSTRDSRVSRYDTREPFLGVSSISCGCCPFSSAYDAMQPTFEAVNNAGEREICQAVEWISPRTFQV